MGSPSNVEFAKRLGELVESGREFAVCTVIEVVGSASARPGAKAIVDSTGRHLWGWVGGGCAETLVADESVAAIRDRRPRIVEVDLDDEVLGVGMPCGGHMRVYIEPVLPEPRLLILGHGLIAETVASIAKLLDFHLTVNDPLASVDTFPGADVRVEDDPDYAKAECGPQTFVVITTQHKSDYEALSRVLRQRPAYVGLVASRKRSALLLERLYEDGFTPEELRRVSAPCGLDLGAGTPQEIGLAIFSEILQQLRGAGTTGRPLREVKGVAITPDGVEIPDGPTSSGECPS